MKALTSMDLYFLVLMIYRIFIGEVKLA